MGKEIAEQILADVRREVGRDIDLLFDSSRRHQERAGMTGTSIVKREAPESRLTVEQAMTVGKMLADSGYFAVGNQAEAVAKILYGQELGFGPVTSLSKIHAFSTGGNERLVPDYTLIAAMIESSPVYDYRVVELTDESCAVEFYRAGELRGVQTYTRVEAVKAGLISNANSPWNKHPRDMLFSTCIQKGSKRYCPTIVAGITMEEDIPNVETPEDEATARRRVETFINNTAEMLNVSYKDVIILMNEIGIEEISTEPHRLQEYQEQIMEYVYNKELSDGDEE